MKKILYIDDRIEDYAPILKEICKNTFEFIFEKYPHLAIEKFKYSEIQPDLILLDLNFEEIGEDLKEHYPDQSDFSIFGLVLLDIFRKMDPDIPIVILTAYKNIEAAHHAGLTGAHAFFIKKESLGENSIFDKQLEAICNNSRYSYDRDQQKLAENVAEKDEYRKLEAKSPGTVAYWHFEERKIVEIIGNKLSEVLFHEYPGKVEITGIDFSGKMLNNCKNRFKEKVDNKDLILEKCTAETLPFDNDSFDIVIAGFGFLSYSSTPDVLQSIHRVVKPKGIIILGTYNYDALFYDVWKGSQLQEANVPISGKIDREKGFLFLSENRKIKVRPIKIEEKNRLLLQNNFNVENYWTFPVLHGSLSSEKLKKIPSEEIDPSKYHGFENFSTKLYEQDLEHSKNLDSNEHYKGYYNLFHCSKIINH